MASHQICRTRRQWPKSKTFAIQLGPFIQVDDSWVWSQLDKISRKSWLVKDTQEVAIPTSKRLLLATVQEQISCLRDGIWRLILWVHSTNDRHDYQISWRFRAEFSKYDRHANEHIFGGWAMLNDENAKSLSFILYFGLKFRHLHLPWSLVMGESIQEEFLKPKRQTWCVFSAVAFFVGLLKIGNMSAKCHVSQTKTPEFIQCCSSHTDWGKTILFTMYFLYGRLPVYLTASLFEPFFVGRFKMDTPNKCIAKWNWVEGWVPQEKKIKTNHESSPQSSFHDATCNLVDTSMVKRPTKQPRGAMLKNTQEVIQFKKKKGF